MKKDPPVRADGRCARRGCGKARKLPATSFVELTHYELEPFCSRSCAERYNGIHAPDLYEGNGGGRKKVYA